jgi:hypothetical protein
VPIRGAFRSSVWAWGATALVVLAIAVLAVVRVSAGPVSTRVTPFQPAPASLVKEVTGIPAAVYDRVGGRSPVVPVSGPMVITGQPPLLAPDASGQRVPEVFYFGAEYCPFCAVERWALVVALSRFGTFKHLGLVSSAVTDTYPATPSFSFVRASYSSRFVAFRAVERWSNVPSPEGGYRSLTRPTPAEAAIVARYDSARYLGSSSAGSIPFVDIANRFLVSGSCFSPSFLAGLTQEDVAAHLADPNDPITRAIVASANAIDAALCSATGGRPGAVCRTPGVSGAGLSGA